MGFIAATERTSEASRPIQPASPTPQRNGKVSVLVIDDDPAVVASTKLLLKLEGYSVQVAASLSQALALKQSGDAWPDVIVADYRLANGSTGIDAIGDLRTLSRRSIPAVLVTGGASSELPQSLAKLGGCEMLSKPFVPNEFLKVVNQLASAQPR